MARAGKDLELALRIKADLEQAHKELEKLGYGVNSVGALVDNTNIKLAKQNDLTHQYAQAAKSAGLSVGQYQQAMRQLPAQITDITTSLVSGMPIWMVAVQQGGQLRDSFGGIGNAGRAVLGTINPLTLAIGAIGGAVLATGAAWYQGTQEIEAYQRALIVTGNVAGTTANSMNDMAERIGNITGSQRQAAAALVELANTGKFTAQQLEQIGVTAVMMEKTLGRAVGSTAAEFKALVEDPAKGIADLNEKYNFLTLAVYDQITALQSEGRELEAVQLAIDTLTGVQNERMRSVVESQDGIEKGWNKIKEAAEKAIDAMFGTGREATLQELERQLSELEKRRDTSIYYARSKPLNEGIEELKAQIRARKAEAEQAKLDAEQRRTNNARIQAAIKIDALEESLLDKAAKRTAELDKYRQLLDTIKADDPNDERLDPQRVERNIAAINARYADKSGDSEATKQASAYEALNRQLSERIAVLKAANDAQQQLNETQRFSERVMASLENGTYKFNDAQKAAVQAQLATLAEIDQANQARADSDALSTINQRLLASQGQQAEAAAIQLEKQYGDLLRRLEARGDVAGTEMVRKLIKVETAKARMAEIQADIDRILARRAQEETSIQAQIQSGLITEMEGRRKIIELHQLTGQEIDDLLPKLREIAEITQDPKVQELIENLKAKIIETKDAVSEFEKAFRAGFEDGLSSAIQELVKGTKNLEDAALSFVQTISEAMLRFAANELASMAFENLKTSFIGITQGAAQAEVAMKGLESTKLATDATMLASSQTALATQTATSTAAAAETTAAWTPAATAASIGSWGTAAAIGLAAVVAALAFKGFSKGGHVRGPGTTTSDSIPALLSDQEYVVRAAVVTQPGAVDFLSDLNRRGMVAVNDWAGIARHSTGGLAGVPAPDMPAPMLQSAQMPMAAGGGDTTLKNNIDLHVYDDPQRIADQAFNSRHGKEAFLVMLARDPGKVRSILKI